MQLISNMQYTIIIQYLGKSQICFQPATILPSFLKILAFTKARYSLLKKKVDVIITIAQLLINMKLNIQ